MPDNIFYDVKRTLDELIIKPYQVRVVGGQRGKFRFGLPPPIIRAAYQVFQNCLFYD